MPSATATKPSAKSSRGVPEQKVAHARSAEPKLVKGRRDFFQYRDLEVAEASAGTLRAQVMSSSQGLSRPTGWHYHECDGQFVYVLKGWVDLEFEDGRTLRIEEGDSLFIPGYLSPQRNPHVADPGDPRSLDAWSIGHDAVRAAGRLEELASLVLLPSEAGEVSASCADGGVKVHNS